MTECYWCRNFPFNMIRERRANGSVWHVPVGVSLEEAICSDPGVATAEDFRESISGLPHHER